MKKSELKTIMKGKIKLESATKDIEPTISSTDRMYQLHEAVNGVSVDESSKSDRNLLSEGVAPNYSVMWSIGQVLPDYLLKILKKTVPQNLVKFKKIETVAMDIWMVSFEGFTRSDAAIDGYVTLYAPGGKRTKWTVDLHFTDALKGNVDQDWEFSAYVDTTATFTTCAKTLKQWVEL